MNLSLKAKCCLSLIIGLGLSLWWVSLAQAQCPNRQCYVDADGVSQTPDGMSWTLAYTDLQDALVVAQDRDEIWVAEGVYYPDKGGGKIDRGGSFFLKNGVKIYGGFAGTETARSQRQPRVNVTVLSGDIDRNDITDSNGVVTTTANITGSNASHVIYNSDVNSTAVLDGFTITAGYANVGGLCPNNCGGGMLNIRSSPEINQISFSGNRAAVNGGGMANWDNSHPKISQVSFSGNTANDNGGGMFNSHNSHPEMSQVSFSGNFAVRGGGMFNQNNSRPAMSQVSFSGNSAQNDGGGMYNINSNPQIVNSIFWGNAGSGLINARAQIYNFGVSSPTIRYTLIQSSGGSSAWDNDLGDDGGNNLDADPLFREPIDPADAPTRAGNLRLRPGSPAIDAGDFNAASGSEDLDGAVRIQGTAVDLGAYEVPVSRQLLYVDADATSPTPNGLSWTTAYTSLQVALFATVPAGDEIWVAEGIYYPDEGGYWPDNDRQANFALKNGVEIYGGFAGTETERSQRQPRVNVTVLSGDIDGNDVTDSNGVVTTTANITGSNAYNVVHSLAVSRTAVLDGFTITAGYAENTENIHCYQNCGGGIYNQFGSPQLNQITFSGNYAARDGGGMFTEVGSPQLTQVSFSGNSAQNNGGGMFTEVGRPQLTQVSFSGNRADNDGGGMYSISSRPQLTQVSFRGNSATNKGGGMFNSNSFNFEMSQVSFSGNYAQNGGGIYNRFGNFEMSQVSFSGNRADDGGGGIYNDASSPQIVNSIFWGNAARGLISATAQIHNSGGSFPTIRYTLVQSSGGSSAWESSLGINSGHNLDADPQFREPIDPADAPTLAGNLRLEPSCSSPSPAVDVGDDSAASGPLDLDGAPRIQGRRVDLGAYESRPTGCSRTSLSKVVSPTMVEPDQRVTYTLLLINSGTGTDSVRLTDTLPSGVEFAAWGEQRGAVMTASEISWQGPVTAGESITITFAMTNRHLSRLTPPITNRAQFSGSLQAGSSSVSYTVLNVPPLAVDDIYTTTEDTPLSIPAAIGLLSNDSDPNKDSLTFYWPSFNPVSSGTLTLGSDGNGSFVYTPHADVNGQDDFAYQLFDGVSSGSALVTITIKAVNDAPVAHDDTARANEDEAVSISVLSNDTDVDNDSLSLAEVSPAQNGRTSISGQQVVYSPRLNFEGTDSFTYRVSDGRLSDTASVTVTVNDAPVAEAGADQSVRVSQSVSLDGSRSRDVDGDALRYGWQQIGGVGVTLNRPTLSRTTFIAPAVPTILTFSLTVTNAPGLASSTDEVVITVTDEAIAGLRAQNSSPIAILETVTFTAHVTAGTNVSYTWLFGDGGQVSGTSEVTHVYTQRGIYTATVVVSNSINRLTATTRVTITEEAIAGLTAQNSSQDRASATLNQVVTFTAHIRAGENVSYRWDFGDRGNAVGQIVTHVYTQVGTYIATVVASNNINTLTATTRVTIKCPNSRCYVDAAGLSLMPDGLSWTTAYTSLQDALAVSRNGDEIWVAAGVYYPDEGRGQSNDDVRASFALKDGVKIYGGFAGTETERSQRQPRVKVTVLSGDIDGNDGTDSNGVVTATANISGDNAYNVIRNRGVNRTAVLDGFTITAGHTDAGGISCPDNCGGGMYNVDSHPKINQISFSGNSAINGGGMNNAGSSPEISQVSFSGNSAINGGGMNNAGSSPKMSQVSFSGNRARDGGGMNNNSSSPQMSQVSFSGNLAVQHGGGMYNNRSSPQINQVSFSGNSAARNGGGMYNNRSSPKMSQISFSGNRAASLGGGMFNTGDSNPHIVNSIFWQNAVRRQMNALAQIFQNPRGSSRPVISYTLIQGSGGSGSAWESSLGDDGGHNLDADPRFREPIDPADAPTSAGNLRLEPDSPAIDVGDDRAASGPQDLEGAPRIQGAGVDLGAYEAPGPIVSQSKAVSPAMVEPDQRVTYTLVLSNSGRLSDSVRLSDTLPSGVEFAAWVAQGGAVITANEISWQGPVTAGESISITFGVSNLNLSGLITNRAQFSGSFHTGSTSVSHTVLNVPPLAADDIYTATEDIPLTIAAAGVLSNDGDLNGDRLTASLQSNVSSGTLDLQLDGSFVYTPLTHFNGLDYFSYQVSDGVLTDTALVTITIAAVNDGPVAIDDTASTKEDEAVSISVLSNDTDVDSRLSLAAVSPAQSGTTSISGQQVVYSPSLNFAGTDSFTYSVFDGSLSDTASVTVTVQAVNDAPVAIDDTASTKEDEAVSISVLSNDTDVDSRLSLAAVSPAQSGTTSISGQQVVYSPSLNFAGTDSFTYSVFDGVLSDTASVTVTVNAVNDAPVAIDDTASTKEDEAVSISVLSNDTDVDSRLSLAAVSPAQSGTTSISGQQVVYSPSLNFAGTDSFTYSVFDGVLSDTASVTVTVQAVNDAPVAIDDTASTKEDEAVSISVLSNDTDVDSRLSLAAVSPAQSGTTSISGQQVVYSPSLNFAGTDSFTYSVFDGVLSDTASVTVTVQAVNDVPLAVAGADQSVRVSQSVTLDGSGSSDVEGDALRYGWQQTGGVSVTLNRPSLSRTTFIVPATPTVLTFSLSVTDEQGLVSRVDEVVITVKDEAIAGLRAQNSSPIAAQERVTFTAHITAGTNVSYTWEFGDGGSAVGQEVSHVYTQAGMYTARVVVSNSTNTLTATTGVTITDEAIAGLTIQNTSPAALNEIITFTANITAGTNVTYRWDFGDGGSAVGQEVTYLYLQTGTYTASVLASNSTNRLTATTGVTITDITETSVVTITGLTVQNSSPAALNEVITFTANITAGDRVNYRWDFGDGFSAVGQIVSHVYTQARTYTATVLAINSINRLTATTGVTITDEAIAGLSVQNSSPAALNEVITFTAKITAGTNVTYRWDFGDGFSAVGQRVTHLYIQARTYTASVLASNSTNRLTATTGVTITDEAIAGLSVQNSSPAALNEVITFTAHITAGTNVSYTWHFGDGGRAVGQRVTHLYIQTGTYTATVLASNSTNSLTATTGVTITEEAIAGLSVQNSSPAALNEVVTFTAHITAGTNVSYTWHFGDGGRAVGQEVSHVYTQARTYTASVLASNSTNSLTATTGVTITDEAIAGLSVQNSSPAALNEVITFTAHITAGTNVSYTWQFGDGGRAVGQRVTHLYIQTGTYTASVLASNSTNSLTATTGVTITDEAIAGLSVQNSSPAALNEVITFTAHITAGTNVSYTWHFGEGGRAVGQEVTYLYLQTGTYTAKVVVSNSTNTLTATTGVTITDEAIAGLSVQNSSPAALNEVITFTAHITAGTNVSYTWHFGDGGRAVGQEVSHVYTQARTYTASVLASNSTNSLTATTGVTITDEAIAGLSVQNSSPAALNEVITFTAHITAGTNVSYTWHFGDGGRAVGQEVSHVYTEARTYTASVLASNSTNSLTATTRVTITDEAIAGLSVQNSSPAAVNEVVTFTAHITAGTNVSYTWHFGDGEQVSGTSEVSRVYTQAGTYTVRVEVSNSSNTLTATTRVTITEEAIAGLSVQNSSPAAVNEVVTFTAHITAGTNVSYTWHFGDGEQVSGTSEVSRVYTQAGTYTVRVEVSNSSNTLTATTRVTITEEAIAGLSVQNSPVTLNEVVTFTANIAAGTNVNYIWDFGDGGRAVGQEVPHVYRQAGTYTVRVEASNSSNTLTATTGVTITDEAIAGLSVQNSSPAALNEVITFTAHITAGTNVSYTWQFGDGGRAVGQEVSHVYTEARTYTASVLASNSTNSLTATTGVTITDEAIAGLSVQNSSPAALNEVITFTAHITAGTNVTYRWDFGDGFSAVGQRVTHLYIQTGTYTASVLASNSTNSLTATTGVTITDEAIAGLSVQNSSPAALNEVVTFTAHITAGTNVSYTWHFGDGEQVSGTSEVRRVYTQARTYTATVEASNSTNTLTATTGVTITDEAIAGLTVQNSSPSAVQERVTFTAHIISGANVSYTWSFGDGEQASGKSEVSHVYTQAGTYTATVEASNSINTLTATTVVSITPIIGFRPEIEVSDYLSPVLRLRYFTAYQGVAYSYIVKVSPSLMRAQTPHVLETQVYTLSAPHKPTWLDFVDSGDNTGTLRGVPGAADRGEQAVTILATDGQVSSTAVLTLTVGPNQVYLPLVLQ